MLVAITDRQRHTSRNIRLSVDSTLRLLELVLSMVEDKTDDDYASIHLTIKDIKFSYYNEEDDRDKIEHWRALLGCKYLLYVFVFSRLDKRRLGELENIFDRTMHI